MFYLKIENEKVVQAPKHTIRKGFRIFGYDSPSNKKMLKEDGFSAFAFPASQAEIVDGKIVKKEVKPVEKTVFTKLEIRRACRALNLEEKLNTLLASNPLFAADWQDAQNIDLNDAMFLKAIENGGFCEDEIAKIKGLLK